MATYRCGEIHDLVIKDTGALVDSWRRLIDRDIVIERFGAKSAEAVEAAMERYRADAGANKGYPIFHEKAASLQKRIAATLASLQKAQIELLHSECLKEFRQQVPLTHPHTVNPNPNPGTVAHC